jgi:hypothetical protein
MKPNKLFLALPLLLLAACAAPQGAIETAVAETRAAEPTPAPVVRTVVYTAVAEVTRQVEVTRVVEVTREVTREATRVVIVTPTFSPTPSHSPTPSQTPTIAPTPSNTPTSTPSNTPTVTPTPTWTPDAGATATAEALGAMTQPRGSGFYLVGVDIAPGKWESQGTGDDCYWARYDSSQEILDNHFGRAGGTVTIRATDYQVEFDDCGTWQYVEGAQRPPADDAAEPKGDGFYTVGVEIAPGKWRSTGGGDECYWARLDAYQNILDNHYGLSGGTVTIWASDYEVDFDGCGAWEYLGP